MLSIKKCSLPDGALLSKYQLRGYYTDCYTTKVVGSISHTDFVTAFYTTSLFKLERSILKWIVSKPSTDNDVQLLADGSSDSFAAWIVEQRKDNQILLSDFKGRTRSWLMTATNLGERPSYTNLYFGSAVVPTTKSGSNNIPLDLVYSGLTGIHKIYARSLLYAAKLHLTAD